MPKCVPQGARLLPSPYVTEKVECAVCSCLRTCTAVFTHLRLRALNDEITGAQRGIALKVRLCDEARRSETGNHQTALYWYLDSKDITSL